VKVNILGELVEKGSTTFSVDTNGFHLHSAIYSARPDMAVFFTYKHLLLQGVESYPLHEALLIGDVAYFDYNGSMEDENDRVELQKSLGPTAKVLVLRNHGILALGDTVEEAFYRVYHIQSACEIQVSSLCSVGKVEDLILLDREKHRPYQAGSVGWAGSTFGPMQKSRLGEHEFEALMRMLDNLWLKAEEVKMTSGSAIKIENPNQFVPLFTDPREVLETRNKSADSELGESGGRRKLLRARHSNNTEPEPPNPFSQLTDQELEEYKKEVQRKQLGIEGEEDQSMDEGVTSPTKSPSAVVSKSRFLHQQSQMESRKGDDYIRLHSPKKTD
ncbi:ADDB protein, partial [Polypterus senegalus]